MRSADALIGDNSWRWYAACRGIDTELFFDEGQKISEALEICKTCPVMRQCRMLADDNETASTYTYGIYAGETPGARIIRRYGGSEIAEKVTEAIKLSLYPGMKLPSRLTLSRRYEINLAVVTEVVRRLEAEGYVKYTSAMTIRATDKVMKDIQACLEIEDIG